MGHKIIKIQIVVLGLTLCFASCYNDKEEYLRKLDSLICDTANRSFITHIQPILSQNCVSCHSATGTAASLPLTDHAQVVTHVTNGKLLGAITHAQGFSAMPKGGNKLPECSIQTITAWINQGAKNN